MTRTLKLPYTRHNHVRLPQIIPNRISSNPHAAVSSAAAVRIRDTLACEFLILQDAEEAGVCLILRGNMEGVFVLPPGPWQMMELPKSHALVNEIHACAVMSKSRSHVLLLHIDSRWASTSVRHNTFRHPCKLLDLHRRCVLE